MKSDYVISAFRDFIKGNRDEAVNTVRMIEACERANGNVNTASKIKRLLDSQGQMLIQMPNAPKELHLVKPERTLDSLIVSADVRASVDGVIREWMNREVLADKGLPPRNILLLHGPSGNGKTSLAQAIATSLSLPFGMVAYNEVINSHLGDTAKGVSKVLDFAATTPCMVMFDEADAIVTSRTHGESGAARECNLTVNQLLIKLDTFGTRSMAVFATNRADVLDSSMRRRMQQSIELPNPGEHERQRMIALCERRWPMIEPFHWHVSVDESASFAEIEAAAMGAARRLVLDRCVMKS